MEDRIWMQILKAKFSASENDVEKYSFSSLEKLSPYFAPLEAMRNSREFSSRFQLARN